MREVDPTLRVTRGEDDGATAVYEITRADEPAARHTDVDLARFSTGTDFAFADEGVRVELRRNRSAQS